MVDLETSLSNKFAGTIDFGTQLEDAYNLTAATCTDLSACLEQAELQGIDIMTDLRDVSGCQRCMPFDDLGPALYCDYRNSHSCLRRCGQAMLFTTIACVPASVAILIACCAARKAVVFKPTTFDTV